HLQPERFGDLARDGYPAWRGHFAARFLKLGFGQKVNHITAHGGFPIETVRAIEDDFILIRVAVHFRRGADERVDVFEVVIRAALVVGNNDSRVRLLFLKWKEANLPLPHLTILRVERAASLLDSFTAALS